MEPGSTLSQRSASESADFDDNRTQIWDLESTRPLLQATPGAAGEKSDQRGRSKAARPASVNDEDEEVLVVKGLRVGPGPVLCGALLASFT